MSTGTLQYNAQSPDEAALVAAAKNFGYVFKVRTDVSLISDNYVIKHRVGVRLLSLWTCSIEEKILKYE